jgi:UDP-N-acetylmuramate-alanine ligase
MAGAEQIAEWLAGHAQPGDVVLLMSNGSFDGLSDKLARRLASLVKA